MSLFWMWESPSGRGIATTEAYTVPAFPRRHAAKVKEVLSKLKADSMSNVNHLVVWMEGRLFKGLRLRHRNVSRGSESLRHVNSHHWRNRASDARHNCPRSSIARHVDLFLLLDPHNLGSVPWSYLSKSPAHNWSDILKWNLFIPCHQFLYVMQIMWHKMTLLCTGITQHWTRFRVFN